MKHASIHVASISRLQWALYREFIYPSVQIVFCWSNCLERIFHFAIHICCIALRNNHYNLLWLKKPRLVEKFSIKTFWCLLRFLQLGKNRNSCRYARWIINIGTCVSVRWLVDFPRNMFTNSSIDIVNSKRGFYRKQNIVVVFKHNTLPVTVHNQSNLKKAINTYFLLHSFNRR